MKVGSFLAFARHLLDIDALPDYETVVKRRFEQFIAGHLYTEDQIRFLRAVQSVFPVPPAPTNASDLEAPLADGATGISRATAPRTSRLSARGDAKGSMCAAASATIRSASSASRPDAASDEVSASACGGRAGRGDGSSRSSAGGASSAAVDASGGLPDGSTFEGAAGLRNALLNRPELFVSTVTEKLLTYALGRGVDYYDAPAVRAIAREARVHRSGARAGAMATDLAVKQALTRRGPASNLQGARPQSVRAP